MNDDRGEVVQSAERAAMATSFQVPLCVPHMAGNEWAYIKECLDTNFVSSVGPFVDRFERAVSSYVGTRFGVATVNGTAALHVALMLAGVQADDEVLAPTLTFIAPVNAVRYVGAWPVFVDAEPDYWQMNVVDVDRFLRNECVRDGSTVRNRNTGRRVSAILPVHVLGHPVDMDALLAVASEFGLSVIEDATESLGAFYRGRAVGTLAPLACFSFNGNKLITTGGGGMIVTDDEALAKRAKYLTTQAKDDAIEFVHGEVGYNYRMTNVLAALGCAQMDRVAEYVEAKRVIAQRYEKGLAELSGVTVMREAPWARSAFWLYTILIDPARFGMDRRTLLGRLRDVGVQTRPLWQPMHQSPAHKSVTEQHYPVADRLNAQALSIPCSVGLTVSEQDRVINAISECASTS